jgi:hypothetical protein
MATAFHTTLERALLFFLRCGRMENQKNLRLPSHPSPPGFPSQASRVCYSTTARVVGLRQFPRLYSSRLAAILPPKVRVYSPDNPHPRK